MLFLLVNTAIKLLILRHSCYRQLSFRSLGHAIGVSILEMLILLVIFMLGLHWLSRAAARRFPGDRVLLSMLFPDMLKLAVFILQIFDTEPNLLFLLGLIIISIQSLAFQVATGININLVILWCGTVIILRFLLRFLFYSISQQMHLGFIL